MRFIQGSFEPLITNEIFEAVQARLKQNSRPRKSIYKHDFAFYRIAKVWGMRCSITAQYGKGNGGTYRYYRCTKKRGKCSQGYLREDLLVDKPSSFKKFHCLMSGQVLFLQRWKKLK